jgi:starvation-inducible DNA-binding protein
MTTMEASRTTARHNGRKATVPPQLATMTDLKPGEVRDITDALNPLVADNFAMYVKIKNFHWHLSGPRFRDYHLFMDELADTLLSAVDTLAERVRRVGGTTIRSIGHISQLQTVQDDNDDMVPADQMLCRLMEDLNHLVMQQRAAHEVCDRCRDYASASELEVIIDQTEKGKWFLFEMTQK